jgi:hypothetical protein
MTEFDAPLHRRATNNTSPGKTHEESMASPNEAPPELARAIVQAKLSFGPATDRHEVEADDRVVRSRGGPASPGGRPPVPRRFREPSEVRPLACRAARSTQLPSPNFDRQGQADPCTSRCDAKWKRHSVPTLATSGSMRANDRANSTIASRPRPSGSGTTFTLRDRAPDTSTKSGKHLLAHELTHTIQQSSAVQRSLDISSAP